MQHTTSIFAKDIIEKGFGHQNLFLCFVVSVVLFSMIHDSAQISIQKPAKTFKKHTSLKCIKNMQLMLQIFSPQIFRIRHFGIEGMTTTRVAWVTSHNNDKQLPKLFIEFNMHLKPILPKNKQVSSSQIWYSVKLIM